MLDSDESDDEPLSVLVAKKLDPENVINERKFEEDSKTKLLKKLAITIKLNRSTSAVPSVVQRPMDVWLYLKDFNTTGPFSCLLCPDWFINRPKVIIHYVLNHKKDFCGICRSVHCLNINCQLLIFHTANFILFSVFAISILLFIIII